MPALLLLCATALPAATVDVYGRLAAGELPEQAAAERAVKPLAAGEKPLALAIWQERHGTPEAARTAWTALPAARRDAFTLASLAWHEAGAGAVPAATSLLAETAARRPQGIEAAAACLAACRLHAADAAAAERDLAEARRWLARAVPEPAYEDWRSQLVRHRLAQAAGADSDNRLGPEYQAFLAADRLQREGRHEAAVAAYRAVVEAHPGTVFAEAAAYETAVTLFWAGDAAALAGELKRLEAAPPAWQPWIGLLRGDAQLVFAGDAKAASASYKAALAAVERMPAEASPALRPAVAQAVASGPAHDRASNGYPRWNRRREGTLRIPPYAGWVADHLRYLALVRLAVASHLAGDAGAAASFAGAARNFDALDRETEHGAGSVLAAQAVADRRLQLDAEELAAIPARARPAVALAEMAYLLYDWRLSADFLDLAGRVERSCAGADGDAGRVCTFYRARCLMMLEDIPACLAGFRAAAGRKVDSLWAKARRAEFLVVHQEDDDGPRRGEAVLLEMQEKLPGTAWAREALYFQADLWRVRDPPKARRLYLEHLRRYPRHDADLIARSLAQLPPEITP